MTEHERLILGIHPNSSERPLPAAPTDLFAFAMNDRFPPGLPKTRPLCACDFGSSLSSPSEGPGVALADVLNQVWAERDEAASSVSACRRIE